MSKKSKSKKARAAGKSAPSGGTTSAASTPGGSTPAAQAAAAQTSAVQAAAALGSATQRSAAAPGSATQRSAAPAAVQAQAAASASFERKAARREAHKDPAAARRNAGRRKLPNWPLLALSVAGMALAGYLSYTAWFGVKLAYCGPGSGCDTVQASRWATLFGMPIAFWGLLTYAALAWIALRVKNASTHWQAAWLLALPALGISLYLTGVSLWVLQATCFYCLASLGLVALVVLVLAIQGRSVPGISWPGWLSASGGFAAAIVLLLALHYSGIFSPAAGPEDPYLKGLAEHLKTAGATFYGASWCPHCQEQKALFGPSAERLPYVECSPNGPNAPAAPVCVAMGVNSFPTWFFGTERHVGNLTVDELAQKTAYPVRPKAP